MSINPIGHAVPLGAVFPRTAATVDALRGRLCQLDRAECLLVVATLNLTVSGFGDVTDKERQERCLRALFTNDEIDRINTWVAKNGGVVHSRVFFRAQLLDALRWASLFCPREGAFYRTFETATARNLLAQALLICSELWGDSLACLRSVGSLEERRRWGLPAIRTSISTANGGEQPGFALGRGWTLTTKHLVARAPEADAEFRKRTGLALDDYFMCMAAILVSYLPSLENNLIRDHTRMVFDPQSFWTSTAIPKAVWDRYLAHDSQTPDQLREGFWRDDDANGIHAWNPPGSYKPLRERPILVVDEHRAVVVDPVFLT